MVTDYEVQDTIGTGTFGICRRIRRKADGAVWPMNFYFGGDRKASKQLIGFAEKNLLLRHGLQLHYSCSLPHALAVPSQIEIFSNVLLSGLFSF